MLCSDGVLSLHAERSADAAAPLFLDSAIQEHLQQERASLQSQMELLEKQKNEEIQNLKTSLIAEQQVGDLLFVHCLQAAKINNSENKACWVTYRKLCLVFFLQKVRSLDFFIWFPQTNFNTVLTREKLKKEQVISELTEKLRKVTQQQEKDKGADRRQIRIIFSTTHIEWRVII